MQQFWLYFRFSRHVEDRAPQSCWQHEITIMSGRIRVYDVAKARELLAPDPSSVPRFNVNGGGSQSGRSRSASAYNVGVDGMLTSRSRARSVKVQKQRENVNRANRHQLYLQQQADTQREEQQKIQERLVANKRRQEAAFEKMYRDLMAGKELTNQVDKLLELQDIADRQKREQMFTEWEENVFNPITHSITQQLDSVGHDTLSRLRREEYDKFLKAANGKQGLFLDIVLENDYDPFVPNARRIKSKTGKLHDPMKRVLTKTEEEKSMVDRSKFEEVKKPGRETLDVRQWHTGKIEATPHGHFAMMMNQPLEGDAKLKAAKLTRSKVTMDHFNVAVGDEVVRSEFPRGKRPERTIRAMIAEDS